MNAKPPVILLVYANDRIDPARHLRNLSEEIGQIRDALRPAEDAGLCEVVIEANAGAERILTVFQDARYRNRIAVFHYAGHADGFGLLTEGARGAVGAHAAGLAAFLGEQRGLELVFLNGCSTAPQLQGLLDAGCPAVIATARAVDDQVAMDFASHFYRGLAGGANLESAFDTAAGATRTRHGDSPRGLYWGVAAEPGASKDQWPWALGIAPGADALRDWTLREAADDPLFGLPDLPADIGLPQEGPFRHLSWFERQHARVFFGRAHEVRQLFETVKDPDSAPILLVYGQSGVGKSSLLDAGLLPRLEADFSVRYLRRDRDLGLLGTVLHALDSDAERLDQAWGRAESSAGRPLLVVLDQVEEVYTRAQEGRTNELADFMAGLGSLFGPAGQRPRGRLLLGFRKEWLPELQQRLTEQGLGWESLFLEGLSREGIVEAVTGPTHDRLGRKYGLQVDDRLAEEIADDLLADPQSPVAPTLQVLLTKLWNEAKRKNDAHPRFTHDLYLELKRAGILLGDFLDQQMAAVGRWRPEAVQSGLLLDLLAYHTTGLGTAEQRTETELLATYGHLQETMPALVQQCRDEYLLADIPSATLQPVKGSRLTHDTLAPLVRERFEVSDRPGQRARRILESRAEEWRGGKDGAVLDDADLGVVEASAEGMPRLDADRGRLIAASQRARARQRRARKYQLTAAAIAAVGIAFTALVAAWQWKAAARMAHLALVRQLAAEATAELDRHPTRALLLAAQSVKLSLDRGEAGPARPQTVLRQQVGRTGGLPLSMAGSAMAFDPQRRWLAIGEVDGSLRLRELRNPSHQPMSRRCHNGLIWALAFDQQGRWLASGSSDETVCLWDVQHLDAQPRILRGHRGPVSRVIFDPAGQWLATGVQTQGVLLWDLQEPASQPRTLSWNELKFEILAFDVTGRWLATKGDDKRIYLWKVEDPTAPPWTLQHEEDNPAFFAWDPRGGRGVTAAGGRSPLLWDLSDPESEPRRLTGPGPFGVAMAIDPGGRWLVVGGGNGSLSRWDLDHPAATPQSLVGHQTVITTLAFDAEGARLASVDMEGSIYLWNMGDPQSQPRRLRGQQGRVTHLAFDPSGTRLITASDDTALRVWEVDRSEDEPLALRGHDSAIAELEIAPDGEWIASRDMHPDCSVRLWPLHHRETEPRVLGGPGDPNRIGLLAVDPLGRWLAAGAGSGSVRLWDLQALGQAPRNLAGHPSIVAALAFDTQGHWLATGDSGGDIALWDLGGPPGAPVHLRGHQGGISALGFDPRGRWLLSRGMDGSIRRWGLAEDSVVSSVLYAGNATRLQIDKRTLALDPGGRWVAARTDDGAIRVWESDRFDAPPSVLKESEIATDNLAFDPRGRWLAASGIDAKLRLWRLTELAAPPLAPRLDGFFFGRLAFDRAGRWLAASNALGSTALWEIQDALTKGYTIPAHQGLVWALAIDPEGRWMATGGNDSIVRLHAIGVPESDSIELIGHSQDVHDLVFDPQGRWLASGSMDGTIRIWQLDICAVLARACRTAGRNLSAAEWRQYAGEVPYQITCPQYPGANPEQAEPDAKRAHQSTAPSASSPASEMK